ncbi:MAG: zinc finger Ran-binding domain-containing protein [Acidobacteriota bacterium]
MTTSWKCAECGLVNFADAANCKRCGAASATAAVPDQPPPPAGIVLEDGYVLPPPPSGGIWRDNATLVMVKEALLPNRCVKCNESAQSVRVRRRLSWHHPVLYLLLFVALLVYAILAAVLSKRAIVYIGLCPGHFQRRRKNLIIGVVLLVAGFIGAIVGFANEYFMIGLLGLAAFLFGMVWTIVASRIVTVKRIDDRLIWLNGINSAYLAQFPPWQGYEQPTDPPTFTN